MFQDQVLDVQFFFWVEVGGLVFDSCIYIVFVIKFVVSFFGCFFYEVEVLKYYLIFFLEYFVVFVGKRES